MLSVFLATPPEPDDLQLLEERLDPSIRLRVGPELPDPADYRILVAGRPTRQHLTASPELEALIIPWAGVPESTRALLLQFPAIAVHNLHYNTAATAEMAMALLLAASKFLVPIDRSLREGDWRPRYEPNPSVLLDRKTALILGYGEVGRRVAQACLGLGMKVLAISRRGERRQEEAGVEVFQAGDLHELLPRADTLIVCLPLTPETEGLIGERELALLPDRAVLVNVSRGRVVEEQALFQSLREGTLYAAGLDVWYEYPADEPSRSQTKPSKYPFHALDNVVLSPHRAGGSQESERDRMLGLARMLNAAARQNSMPNRVDVNLGY